MKSMISAELHNHTTNLLKRVERVEKALQELCEVYKLEPSASKNNTPMQSWQSQWEYDDTAKNNKLRKDRDSDVTSLSARRSVFKAKSYRDVTSRDFNKNQSLQLYLDDMSESFQQ